MHFVLDGRFLFSSGKGQAAGIEQYTQGIFSALFEQGTAHTFTVFVDQETPSILLNKFFSGKPHVQWSFFKKRIPFWSVHFSFPHKIKKEKPDLFFAPHGQLPLGFFGTSVICLHDLAIFFHPEWFPDKKIGRWFSTKVVIPLSLKKSSFVIVVSRATQQEVLSFFSVPKEKICVVYPAINPSNDFVQKKNPFPYFLCLGTLEPRKNFSLALNAFDLFLEKYPEQQGKIQLLLVGKRGWNYKQLLEEKERINVKYFSVGHPVIQELGYVSSQEKWTYLRHAKALLFPSFYEGFGLPVLEALSVGTPVITTCHGSLEEVGGQFATYVSSTDPNEMMQAISQIVFQKDPEAKKNQRKKYAQSFSWQRAAKELLDIFQQVVQQSKKF